MVFDENRYAAETLWSLKYTPVSFHTVTYQGRKPYFGDFIYLFFGLRLYILNGFLSNLA